MKVELLEKIGIEDTKLQSYVFSIKELPRFVLQELARHRQASYSVKSSRYTLTKEFKNENYFMSLNTDKRNRGLAVHTTGLQRAKKYIALSDNKRLHFHQLLQLDQLLLALHRFNLKSDEAKYLLPETWLCDLIWTIDKDSLDNFLELRSSPSAHKAIQELANKVKELI